MPSSPSGWPRFDPGADEYDDKLALPSDDLLLLALCFLPVVSYASLLLRTETFEVDPGWTGLRNQDVTIGNAIGFSNTNETGGVSPAGEAGGRVARSKEASFYADTNLGGTLNLTNFIQASGEFDFPGTFCPLFNNGIHVGHRNTSLDSTDDSVTNFIGFEFAED